MAHVNPTTLFQARFHSVPTSDQRDEDEHAVKPWLAVHVSEKENWPPQQHRRLLSLSVLVPAVVDICLAIAALYFIAFGILAYRYRGTVIEDDVVVFLLRAARLGPTVLPIMFAGIVGRCLTAVAAWRLEHGVTIGAIEYLLGSRTVFSVVTTPIRLRTLHLLAPLLILLWALSPLGGQANLRVVSAVTSTSNTTADIKYLDSMSQELAQGVSGWSDIATVVQATLIGAMISPRDSKKAPMDLYENIKIPLLEPLSRSQQPDFDGWYTVPGDGQDTSYSSLIGLPIGLGQNLTRPRMAQYKIESTYMYTECETYQRDAESQETTRLNSAGSNSFVEAFNGSFGLSLYENSSLLIQGDSLEQQTRPRRVAMRSLLGPTAQGMFWHVLECDLTTSYVETAFTCLSDSCHATHIRESKLPHVSRNISALDGLSSSWDGEGPINRTYNGLASNTEIHLSQAVTMETRPDHERLEPLENWFYEPGSPFQPPFRKDAEFPTDNNILSMRFAQMLNTYWLCNIGAYGLTGNMTSLSGNSTWPNNAGALNSTAVVFTHVTVLACDMLWLTVLMVSGSVMFLAALAAVFLSAARKGPEVLDCFASTLRDSPYASEAQAHSTEDGTDMARRLRNTTVILGDVQPENEVGKIAISTMSETQHVQRLRSQRLYS